MKKLFWFVIIFIPLLIGASLLIWGFTTN